MDVYMTLCVFLSRVYFIPSLYCVIKNKLRIQGENETGRERESKKVNVTTHFNTNFDYEMRASIYRASRKTGQEDSSPRTFVKLFTDAGKRGARSGGHTAKPSVSIIKT